MTSGGGGGGGIAGPGGSVKTLYGVTSTTSLAIPGVSPSSRTWFVSDTKGLQINCAVIASVVGDPNTYIAGVISGLATNTSLAISSANMTDWNGSGTYSNWIIDYNPDGGGGVRGSTGGDGGLGGGGGGGGAGTNALAGNGGQGAVLLYW
jgi:hypothetical protein